MVLQAIGQRIRDVRGSYGWSLHRLARKAGVSAMTVRSAENGNSVSTTTLYRLAKALEIDLVTLVIGVERKAKPRASK